MCSEAILQLKRTPRVQTDITSGFSGLRSLEVTFPPHDSRYAGSNPAEVVEFLWAEKFREQVLREGL